MTPLRPTRLFLLTTLVTGCAAVCTLAQIPPAPEPNVYALDDEGLRPLIESYGTDWGSISRFYPLRLAPARSERLGTYFDGCIRSSTPTSARTWSGTGPASNSAEDLRADAWWGLFC